MTQDESPYERNETEMRSAMRVMWVVLLPLVLVILLVIVVCLTTGFD